MLLKKLIKNIPFKFQKIKVLGLATHSNKVKKGFIFFAIRGHKINGEKYIVEAIKKGAVAIVCSKKCNINYKNFPIFRTSNIRLLLSQVASKFYKLKPKNIIAVTGTNGKTSVADLFYQILTLNNVSVASIGTLGIKHKNRVIETDLTSPNALLLHQTLQNFKKNKTENVIIEASSHGLDQKRINHLKLKAGIFTNFSQDHLDYHKSMRSYLNAKLYLFEKILKKGKIIISDKSLKEFSYLKKISKRRKLRLIDISKINEKLKKNKNLNLNEFQLKNLSMAIIAAKLCNLKEKKIFNSLKKIRDVNGRMELVKTFSNNIKVYVDFAHTPDALLKSLNALKNNYGKNISLVFGCGGDRDYKKRPLMAKIASTNCKKIYVTDDNPRDEDPNKIRIGIIKNIKNKNCLNIGNRQKAIKTSILNAEPNEIILVAGKGHETKQIYKNKVIKITDKQIIRKLKFKIKKLSIKKQDFFQNQKILEEIKKGVKLNFHGLAIDSRVIKKNNLFLTIKGKNKDGMNYIPNALIKGAKKIISSKNSKRYNKKIIRVKNEKSFLNQFAYKKRNYTNAKILAITGSTGKTSLKNLINNILKKFGKTFCSPKSYNNHFGVPLSLSQLSINDKYGVFEVGMSKAGEINTLTKLIRPNLAIITNIGEAHIENFKNTKGIADAKGEIIDNVQKKGTIILNRDDKYFSYLQRKAKFKNLKVTSFGMSRQSDVHPILIKKNSSETKLILNIKGKIFKTQIKNINIYNVLASLALLKELNLNLEKILNYFKYYEPTEGRGRIYDIKRYNKRFKLIDESYNANPSSVKNAIKNFSSFKKSNFKKYLLLGDMLELGHKADFFHKDISKVINNSDIDKVFIKGHKTLVTYKNINIQKRGNIFQHDEDVDFTLNNIIANNDYLMIKGSNATGLNNFCRKLIKGY